MNQKYLKIAMSVIVLAFSQGSWGFGVSVGPGPATETFEVCDPIDAVTAECIIGPVALTFDPAAGPWVKMLSGITTQTSIIIHETITLAGGPDWTDWHEELDPSTPPGWTWTLGPGTGIFAGGLPVPGLTTSLDPSGRVIWFDFAPLPATGIPPTTIEIWKELTCPAGACGPGSITIIEFPTVPIPASVWLFGSALGLLGWMRRRTGS